jgi:hypothetical protein
VTSGEKRRRELNTETQSTQRREEKADSSLRSE